MENYYLMFDHKQEMEYWDNMVPYERDIYLGILIAKKEEDEKKNKKKGGEIFHESIPFAPGV